MTQAQIFRTRYRHDWPAFAKDILGVYLDDEQVPILRSIQNNRRISIRSGHARGKDFITAVASTCFLYLEQPCRVFNTAPTGRQAVHIMMAEISKVHASAQKKLGYELGGKQLTDRIVFPNKEWYLMAFKAGEAEQEPWSGFHSGAVMVAITEATGLDDRIFESLEGILTGNSKLVLAFNPLRTSGEAFKSITDPMYVKHVMNCMDAPNVKAKKILIRGQVDYEWIDEKIRKKQGWVVPIDKDQALVEMHDFEWEGKWYRPMDIFRVRVLGEPPLEADDMLIPLSWIEASFNRYDELNGKKPEGRLQLGVDVAGEGRDFTVFVHRYGNVVRQIKAYSQKGHMQTAGLIKNELKGKRESRAYIDSIGEGAGVYARCEEQGLRAESVKFSESAKGLKDYTGERTFANLRAYCYWAVRDALNPQFKYGLALPRDEELMQELNNIKWDYRSNGDILLEPKDNVKDRIGRSPDKADALALTFAPEHRAPRARLL